MRDAINTKDVSIKDISTNEIIFDPLTSPIPKDALKAMNALKISI